MATPWRVRILSAVVRRIPRGRYALLPLTGSRGTFVASLPPGSGGARFRCDLGDLICREACVTGFYEPPVSRIIQQLLRRGGTMIDVGANWGYFTLLGASITGAEGTVVALEPDPRQFEALRANLALNPGPNVVTIQAAAGAREGRAVLQGYGSTDANRGVSRLSSGQVLAAHTFDVQCVRLDDVAAAYPCVDLVKIDVEGAEGDVLHGMERGLQAHRYRAIVLEMHPALLRDSGQDASGILSLLERHGYSGWTIDCTPPAYRRAADPSITVGALLRPLAEWRHAAWPHLLWRC